MSKGSLILLLKAALDESYFNLVVRMSNH